MGHMQVFLRCTRSYSNVFAELAYYRESSSSAFIGHEQPGQMHNKEVQLSTTEDWKLAVDIQKHLKASTVIDGAFQQRTFGLRPDAELW